MSQSQTHDKENLIIFGGHFINLAAIGNFVK